MKKKTKKGVGDVAMTASIPSYQKSITLETQEEAMLKGRVNIPTKLRMNVMKARMEKTIEIDGGGSRDGGIKMTWPKFFGGKKKELKPTPKAPPQTQPPTSTLQRLGTMDAERREKELKEGTKKPKLSEDPSRRITLSANKDKSVKKCAMKKCAKALDILKDISKSIPTVIKKAAKA